jgi:xylulokinase
MTRSGLIIGVDIGTSAAKILCVDEKGPVAAIRKQYVTSAGNAPATWIDAVRDCLARLKDKVDLNQAQAIAIASQVNTYILCDQNKPDDQWTVLEWTSQVGKEQLQNITSRFDADYFLKHISMPHPKMVSYPIVRIKYLKDVFARQWDSAQKILQPKDYLYYKLTGIFASDPFTWRGLSNIEDLQFHEDLLKDNGIPRDYLPELLEPFSAPGHLTDKMSKELFINKTVPVYLGCNDFFAALLGTGIYEPNQYFDICGTSEHIGAITDRLDPDCEGVCGPFFNNFVKYGVTTSSGSSLAWANRNLGDSMSTGGSSSAPIFLPYLQGERAPIWDSDARGVFFGLEKNHDRRSLLYSVKEGVAFSLHHIWKSLGLDKGYNGRGIRISGTPAADETLNQLKADTFGTAFDIVDQKESAALGAAIIAAVGAQWFKDVKEAITTWVKIGRRVEPNPKNARLLAERFEIYQQLYPALKETFNQLRKLREQFSEP